MSVFEITYVPTPDESSTVAACNCRYVSVEVISKRDNQQAIEFTAFLQNGEGSIIAQSPPNTTSWTSDALPGGRYFLEVRPKTGDRHHDFRSVPVEGVFREMVQLHSNYILEAKLEVSRKSSVIYDIPYDFEINDPLTADGSAPAYESGLLAALTNDFWNWPELVQEASQRFAIPETYILSILVMETTHGYYDEPLDWVGSNASIRPMNVNVDYWTKLFTREEMHDTRENIFGGTFLLARIVDRLAPNNRTTRRIATLYNNINAETVTDYGARVSVFVRTLRPDWMTNEN